MSVKQALCAWVLCYSGACLLMLMALCTGAVLHFTGEMLNFMAYGFYY